MILTMLVSVSSDARLADHWVYLYAHKTIISRTGQEINGIAEELTAPIISNRNETGTVMLLAKRIKTNLQSVKPELKPVTNREHATFCQQHGKRKCAIINLNNR